MGKRCEETFHPRGYEKNLHETMISIIGNMSYHHTPTKMSTVKKIQWQHQ